MKNVMIGVLLAVMFIAVPCTIAQAMPVAVDYTISGVSGNYRLNFTITNNMPFSMNQNIYFFGVDVAHIDPMTTVPTGWTSLPYTWDDNISYGGSDRAYPSSWFTNSFENFTVSSGNSLSGFIIYTPYIPDSVNFFVYTIGSSPYYGDDAFHQGYNPGFEGEVDKNDVVPEPMTVALVSMGLGVLGFTKRKVKRQ